MFIRIGRTSAKCHNFYSKTMNTRKYRSNIWGAAVAPATKDTSIDRHRPLPHLAKCQTFNSHYYHFQIIKSVRYSIFKVDK